MPQLKQRRPAPKTTGATGSAGRQGGDARNLVPFSDSLGKSLRRRRLELGLSLDEIARSTRIQKPYLKALEGGRYTELPHSIYSLGFVRRYAKTLGLNGKTAVAKYLAERGPMPDLPTAKQPPKQRIAKPIIGSRVLIWLVAVAIVATVIGYLGLQLVVLTSPPKLALSSPASDFRTDQSAIEVRGQTNPGARVVINGQPAYVDETGSFSLNLSLASGLNTIVVEATNNQGKVTRIERHVIVEMGRNES